MDERENKRLIDQFLSLFCQGRWDELDCGDATENNSLSGLNGAGCERAR
jgi:hypothetical protein